MLGCGRSCRGGLGHARVRYSEVSAGWVGSWWGGLC